MMSDMHDFKLFSKGNYSFLKFSIAFEAENVNQIRFAHSVPIEFAILSCENSMQRAKSSTAVE